MALVVVFITAISTAQVCAWDLKGTLELLTKAWVFLLIKQGPLM